ncbi:MAG: hypothetical protein KBA11_09865 [Sedimentibacter sp.]|nr:hypothetical protein [Sedimentibacter sp.]
MIKYFHIAAGLNFIKKNIRKVIKMQIMFHVKEGVREYVNRGRKYPFPPPPVKRCNNPHCNKIVHYKKHGFYERNYYSSEFGGKIIIRRYICPLCSHTISYIPSFCLPRFINAVKHIFDYICCSFYRKGSIKSVIEYLNSKIGIQFSRQILYHYRKRFIDNINAIQAGIRQLIGGVKLPDTNLGKGKKAREVLAIMRTEYQDIQVFSQQFHQTVTKTFLALNKL